MGFDIVTNNCNKGFKSNRVETKNWEETRHQNQSNQVSIEAEVIKFLYLK